MEKGRRETEKWSEGLGQMKSPIVEKFFAIFFEGREAPRIEAPRIENEFMVKKY
jgi:hypothetical protein